MCTYSLLRLALTTPSPHVNHTTVCLTLRASSLIDRSPSAFMHSLFEPDVTAHLVLGPIHETWYGSWNRVTGDPLALARADLRERIAVQSSLYASNESRKCLTIPAGLSRARMPLSQVSLRGWSSIAHCRLRTGYKACVLCGRARLPSMCCAGGAAACGLGVAHNAYI